MNNKSGNPAFWWTDLTRFTKAEIDTIWLALDILERDATSKRIHNRIEKVREKLQESTDLNKVGPVKNKPRRSF